MLFMNERTLHVLEFNKVIDLLMEETASSVGKEAVQKLTPQDRKSVV